jgi:hypothetical protein
MSGTVHLTKDRKIESSEKTNRKFSREWSPDIFSIELSSRRGVRVISNFSEEIGEILKKIKKTREESRENRRKTRKSA